jgi:hypothetical protein
MTIDPVEAGYGAAGGILGRLGGPSRMPVSFGSILGQAGAAAQQARGQAVAQNEMSEDRAALRKQREQAVLAQRDAAQKAADFQSILGKSENPADPISILGAGIQSGAFGPKEISDFSGKVLEKQAAREQRMDELKLRLGDQKIAREEREAFQRSLVDLQAKNREELLKLSATLRPAPAPEALVPVKNADGKIVYTPRSKAIGEEVPPSNNSRALPPAAIKELGEKGESVTTFKRLLTGFKDGFAGKGTAFIGNAENLIGRNIGAGRGDQADWWQDYQMQKNLIRNKLFGSALTATESAEFEKAAINPGMTPDIIRKNLNRQKSIAARAAVKLSGAYKKGGYSDDQITEALGVDPADLSDEKDPWEK